MKLRADQLLVQSGLAPSRTRAQALVIAGKVYAGASEVVSAEPIRADNPLLGLDNMIITPHIAWASHEARQRLMDTAVENVRNFLNGTPSNNVAK